MSPRIAIIGAGVSGCGAARRAAELGAKDIVVIDKATPASGSSGLSAGVYNAQTLRPLDIEIRVRERELLFRFERDRGLPLARIGNLRFATQDADVGAFEHSLAFQRSLGATDAQILSRAEIKKLVPDLAIDDVTAALYGPNDGHLDGHLLCSVMVEEAREKGVRFLLNTQLNAYRKDGSVHVLSTSGGEVEADIVINAAGAWAPQVGKTLGHPVAVNPEVHEVVRVKLPRDLGYTVPMCNFYVPGQAAEGIYFRQDGPDSLIAGLHTYDSVPGLAVTDPDNFSPPDGDDNFLKVAQMVSERLKVDDLGFRAGWCGLYPLSADGLFQVGPYKADPSVLVVAGLGGVGITSGVVLGALAAEWALLGKPITVPQGEVCLPDRPSLLPEAA
ncbi:FAD-binding oxidoreductase [Mesorhizobium sp. M3A.F.Ca.ET.080.04.2.1]|uniref:NAD(P)/FAD-dependent oxidoreductase n=1 Tax=Mesorhizobium sp. M3A.F.Ca.ET.080.04.2.1 TaxID=2493676 RepID=UPI000F7519A5|nr:FAD-binding oxidoreductase [Mesorhizobium sp. M3A.F.Ca.ET.080.04.2.1]AZO07980.1 FAD-binding oxidoreductase [Mesorhizobium sp. M3A.F.Ca.ET.080.04.2.1]